MIELLYVPIPVLSVVKLLESVGLCEVLQHIPLTVIFAPPSFVITPPLVAVVLTIKDASVVVKVGNTASVVKLTSLP